MQYLADEHRKHKKGSHTYSQQLVEDLGHGLELNADEIKGLLSVGGF